MQLCYATQPVQRLNFIITIIICRVEIALADTKKIESFLTRASYVFFRDNCEIRDCDFSES